MNRWQQLWTHARRRVPLAHVDPILPGADRDALLPLDTAGASLDRPWPDQLASLTSAAGLWRTNPLARRLVNLVTSFVVGDGISVTSDDPALAHFLAAFWHHPQNQLTLRQYAWCDELSRAGELFITLHLNPADGMSYVRGLPASSIDRVISAPGDYETELAFHEAVPPGDPDYPAGRWWHAPDADEAADPARPICLHFAVNRPVGCVRGESDLAPVRHWLERYHRWLEDRVRLNAGLGAFLWIVKVRPTDIKDKMEKWRTPPDPGTVLFIDRDKEEWQPMAPSLHGSDAAADGRALRWMIVAGGPGVGLVDLGEGEEANLATAKAMGEQRSRFMRARQTYFGWALASIALAAYNRAAAFGYVRGAPATLADLRINLPDISPADNRDLGASAAQAADALTQLAGLGLRGERWQRLALRTVLKFAGEPATEDEVAAILRESK